MTYTKARKGSFKGKVCIIEGCNEPMQVREMCNRHYHQWHHHGEVRIGVKGRHGPPEERFWNFVEKGAHDECWLWMGNRDKDGYGSLRTPKTQIRAHRLSYQIHKGEIPPGMLVRHICNTPSCVNPNHLLVGTQKDNMKDRKLSGRSPTNENHPNCKYSDELVAMVRAATGKRKDIAKQFGISESQVGNIISGRQRPKIEDDNVVKQTQDLFS